MYVYIFINIYICNVIYIHTHGKSVYILQWCVLVILYAYVLKSCLPSLCSFYVFTIGLDHRNRPRYTLPETNTFAPETWDGWNTTKLPVGQKRSYFQWVNSLYPWVNLWPKIKQKVWSRIGSWHLPNLYGSKSQQGVNLNNTGTPRSYNTLQVEVASIWGIQIISKKKKSLPISFPYHSHTSRDSYGSSMGMGVPLLLGVPRISLDDCNKHLRCLTFSNLQFFFWKFGGLANHPCMEIARTISCLGFWKGWCLVCSGCPKRKHQGDNKY